jgi:hypothetical protein
MREEVMKSYTKEEFIEYVKKLEFDELENCAKFVSDYYEYYKSLPDDPKEDKDAAWEKYMILMSKFGMMFVSFTIMVIGFRKKLNDEIAAEEAEDPSGAALENRTSET